MYIDIFVEKIENVLYTYRNPSVMVSIAYVP